ncbi:MAG: hypothetical protein A3G29_12670 [Burkholderiales bacterium RIFCSPLOWO2_12_FULL_64_99]|nr:MAG: hypothetical protein A3E52_04325 [Burkholderiales bacterium RIFCSPHIGHO2_12_FULL_63_20]OGB67206.1 MAG: hypothetical protein A3G29_12670 [Burkholderiales bacterium RIFCSPLOWO2_12_FULL_64_99]
MGGRHLPWSQEEFDTPAAHHQFDLFALDPWGGQCGIVELPHPSHAHIRAVLPCIGLHGFAPEDRLIGVWCVLLDMQMPAALRIRIPYASLDEPDQLWASLDKVWATTRSLIEASEFAPDAFPPEGLHEWLDADLWAPLEEDPVWGALQAGSVHLQQKGKPAPGEGDTRQQLPRDVCTAHGRHVMAVISAHCMAMPHELIQPLRNIKGLGWTVLARLNWMVAAHGRVGRTRLLQALRTEPLAMLKRMAATPYPAPPSSPCGILLGTARAKDDWRAQGLPWWLHRLAWKKVPALFTYQGTHQQWLELLRLMDRLRISSAVVANHVSRAWACVEQANSVDFETFEQMVQTLIPHYRDAHDLDEILPRCASKLSKLALMTSYAAAPEKILRLLSEAFADLRRQFLDMLASAEPCLRPTDQALALLAELGDQEIRDQLNGLLSLQPPVPANLQLPHGLSVHCLLSLELAQESGHRLKNCLQQARTMFSALPAARAFYVVSRLDEPLAALAIQYAPHSHDSFDLVQCELAGVSNAQPSREAVQASETLRQALSRQQQQWATYANACTQFAQALAQWDEHAFTAGSHPILQAGGLADILRHIANRSGTRLMTDARHIVLAHKTASVSMLQRHLRVGYQVACTLMAQLENEQLVSAPNANGQRVLLQQAPDLPHGDCIIDE